MTFSVVISHDFCHSQRKVESSLSMLVRLRQALLAELKQIIPTDGSHVLAENQVVKACALIRLYCALKGMASLRCVLR